MDAKGKRKREEATAEEVDNDETEAAQQPSPPRRIRGSTPIMPYKYLNDPVHGLIPIHEKHFEIIDTPIFQRLRDLKQLGGMYLVFPGASHNRFEHCVGTCYLAGQWMQHLCKLNPGLATEREMFLVEVAGLCHDLGHGPFSHTFEGVMKTLCKNVGAQFEEWEHENLSVELLRLINEEKGVLSEEELDKVAHMIRGKVWNDDPRKFLYRIVNNEKTSIDVDKFDYLSRDCKSAALPLGFDFNRLIEFSNVGDDYEIVFRPKEAYNIYQMFNTRFALHQQTYQHPVVKGIELMISDIFLMASRYLALEDMIREKDYRYYASLTDGILRELERKRIQTNSRQAENDEEEAHNLAAARNLVLRMRNRDLYKFVAERKWLDQQKEMSMAGENLDRFNNEITQLLVVKIKFFASAGQPPFKSELFAHSAYLTTAEISSMIPQGLPCDTFLRLYAKDTSDADRIQQAVEEFRQLDASHLSPLRVSEKTTRQHHLVKVPSRARKLNCDDGQNT
ncbi:Deoxynucleoside triphosphate triphosphohydrolase SAMHD1 [Balamuthia mandrillaris]